MEVYEKTIRISRGLLGFIDLRELLFKERPEDRRVNIAPIEPGRFEDQRNLCLLEWEGLMRIKPCAFWISLCWRMLSKQMAQVNEMLLGSGSLLEIGCPPLSNELGWRHRHGLSWRCS